MLTVFRLIFAPFNTWDRIVKDRRNVAWMLGLYFIPLLLVCLATEAWSLMNKGHGQEVLRNLRKVSEEGAIQYTFVHLFGYITVLFLAAGITCWVAKSFHCEVNYDRCVIAVGYSLGALSLGRLVDAVPFFNTWIAWGIGVLLTLSLLYNGLPRVVRPEPTKGLGLFFLSSIVLIAMTGFVHFLALMVLKDPGVYK